MLKIENISINFGGIKALDNVNMEVKPGHVCGLIGPNGSGKSTLLNILSRIYNPSGGKITIGGVDLLKQKPHHMPKIGVGRTFQNLELFDKMTAIQNLMVSQTLLQDYSLLASAFYTRRFKRIEQECLERAHEILKLVGLENYDKRLAQDLSFGQQKLLELGRSLVFNPDLLLLDEPAAGLSPVMMDRFLKIIADYKSKYSLTIIIVEHVTKLVMDIADRVTVLNFGRVISEGTPDEIQSDSKVIDVYLGRGIEEAFSPGLDVKSRSVAVVKTGDSQPSDRIRVGAPIDGDSRKTLMSSKTDDSDCLKLEGIDAYYGKLKVLHDVTLRVPLGSVVALMGGNGSGKSTTLKAISGIVSVKNGKIIYKGKQVPLMQPHKVVKMGIVQVPQHREVFPYLNVKENLAMGAYQRSDKKSIEEDLEMVYGYFPRLKERRKQLAAGMSGGEQQMLAIGRALMSKPEMLIMDEPSASLAPTLIEEIIQKLAEINRNGTTLFIVEQNVDIALSLAKYVYIIRQGRIVLEDWAPNFIEDNERIIASYFG